MILSFLPKRVSSGNLSCRIPPTDANDARRRREGLGEPPRGGGFREQMFSWRAFWLLSTASTRNLTANYSPAAANNAPILFSLRAGGPAVADRVPAGGRPPKRRCVAVRSGRGRRRQSGGFGAANRASALNRRDRLANIRLDSFKKVQYRFRRHEIDSRSDKFLR